MLQDNAVVGIRCNSVGPYEIELFNQISEVLGSELNVYFIRDARAGNVSDNHSFQKKTIDFDSGSVFLSDGVYGSFKQNWAWQCGDYFYYAMMRERDFSFMWLIEGDVYASSNAWESLFASSKKIEADFMAYNLGEMRDEWYWAGATKKWFSNGYKCSFPVTRISSRAAGFSYGQRALINDMCAKGDLKLPNDEGFVPSSVASAGFSLASLNKVGGIDSSKFSTVMAIPRELCLGENKIFHSSLFFSDYIEKLEQRSRMNSYRDFENSLRFAFGSEVASEAAKEFFGRLIHESSEEVSERASQWAAVESFRSR